MDLTDDSGDRGAAAMRGSALRPAVLALAAWLLALPAAGQPVDSGAVTGPVSSHEFTVRALPPDVSGTPVEPQEIAGLFIDACVRTEGALAQAVDQALADGLEPRDAYEPDIEALLDGQVGSVMAINSALTPVFLVVTSQQRCTVWADRTNGPALHEALLQGMAALGASGRVERVLERTIQRGGMPRRHLQLRYRRAGGSQTFGINAVTTVGEQPGVQAFQMAPVADPVPDPDGLRVR